MPLKAACSNDLLINSLSLLNHRLMQFCLEQAESRCFPSEVEREQFTANVAAAADDIENFFSGAFRNKILSSAREGNRDAIELNELLRSPESITAPEKYVRKLLASTLVKASSYYQEVISAFYLPRQVTDRVTVCTTSESFYHLTDLIHGQAVYQPGKWLVPDYVRTDGKDNTARIPAIIGNTLFDNQERQDSGLSPSREVGIQAAALPYYLTPTRQKQRHSVFIQDNGVEGAWFFVASNKSANNTIAKQSLVYNAMITGECGTQIPVLSHPLGELFFSSFTFDIVKLRESAKTSILQKIVEICLHN